MAKGKTGWERQRYVYDVFEPQVSGDPLERITLMQLDEWSAHQLANNIAQDKYGLGAYATLNERHSELGPDWKG